MELANPITTAAGCAASGRELAQFFDLHRLGALVTRSITMAPRAGRPTPRMAETPAGLLNAVGLQGPGVDAFLERELPWLAQRGIKTIVSVGGGTVAEYAALARRLADAPGVTAVEVNLSCPNIEDRGRVFAREGGAAAEVIASVRSVMRYDVPVIAKLAPDVADIAAVARACVREPGPVPVVPRPSGTAAARRPRFAPGSRGGTVPEHVGAHVRARRAGGVRAHGVRRRPPGGGVPRGDAEPGRGRPPPDSRPVILSAR
ncbi:dihydroorotate dehydrogenase [Nonomuraea sp. NPDC055795]